MRSEQFEAMLKANERRIYHYLYQLTGNEADTQDLVQAVFYAFYEHIDRIEEGTATAYLYRIAHNKALNHLKKAQRYIVTDPARFRSLAQPGSSEPVDHEPLRKALRELPIKLSAVIHLQYYDKLSYKEIAEQLNISVKAVESLLVRAKKLLRKKILEENPEWGV
ncbi:MAG: RNA polymerase sigma factor [Candidatus Cloacimonetes bacterium]|nr:RNA polymerase sigma factor [Candidatus Cloacimonadota bacterium]